MSKGGEPSFEWDVLVPRAIHPLRVAIIEALRWVDRPLSASELTKLIDDQDAGLSHISYHVGRLADVGALKKVRQRQVRGSTEKFYSFLTLRSNDPRCHGRPA